MSVEKSEEISPEKNFKNPECVRRQSEVGPVREGLCSSWVGIMLGSRQAPLKGEFGFAHGPSLSFMVPQGGGKAM